jgi:hypothetical protein
VLFDKADDVGHHTTLSDSLGDRARLREQRVRALGVAGP